MGCLASTPALHHVLGDAEKLDVVLAQILAQACELDVGRHKDGGVFGSSRSAKRLEDLAADAEGRLVLFESRP